MGNQSLRAAVEALAANWADQPNDYDEDTEQQIDDGNALRELLAAHPEPTAQVNVFGRPFDREAALTALEPYMKCSPQLARETASRALDAALACNVPDGARPVQPGYNAVYAVLRTVDSPDLPQATIGLVWRAVHAFREALGIRGSDPLTPETVEAGRRKPKWTDLFGIAPDMTAEQLFGVDPDAEALGAPLRRQAVRITDAVMALANGHEETFVEGVCGEQPWNSDVPVHGCVREPGHEPFHRDAEGREFVSRATIAEAEDIARPDGDQA
jgi:hypothetical protein